jgi:predicted transposase YdaD
MTKKADIGGKRLISLATDEWSRWVTGNPQIQARESPWYNEIPQEGTELGIEQGRQQGIEQGRQQEILEGIELGLELKFGAAGRSLMPEIRQIQDLETLKQIRSSLRTVESIEQLRQFYG